MSAFVLMLCLSHSVLSFVTLQAWITTSGNKRASRDELLAAINSLSQPNDREALLRRHGFWKVGGCHTHQEASWLQMGALTVDPHGTFVGCKCDLGLPACFMPWFLPTRLTSRCQF